MLEAYLTIPQEKAIVKEATMFSKDAYSIFLLRTSALVSSLISVALVASSRLQYHFSSLYGYEGFEAIVTFRYVMAVGVISLVYGVAQLPFAALYALKHKSLMPLHLQFYADQVMSVLLATGSGAGIAVSCEFKNISGGGGGGGISGSGFGGLVHYDVYDYYIGNITYTTENDTDKRAYSFFNKLLAGSVFLFLAWLCLALVSIISYNSNNNNQTLSTNQHHRQANTVELSPKEPAKQTHVPTEDVRASTDDVPV